MWLSIQPAAANVGQRDIHLAVKTARRSKAASGIISGRLVGRHNNHTDIGFKPIHLATSIWSGAPARAHQYCLPLILALMLADGINLVNEYDVSIFLALSNMSRNSAALINEHPTQKSELTEIEKTEPGFTGNTLKSKALPQCPEGQPKATTGE
jgi:hypothetical protein